jgi:hypothetical protein
MDAMGWLPTKEKLQSQIEVHEKALKEIASKMERFRTMCGSEYHQIVDVIEGTKRAIARAEKAGDTAQVKELMITLQQQKEHAAKEKKIEEGLPRLEPEKLIAEINAHKKAIAEAQYELEFLDFVH